jgi:tetratricopeptide (TPR) repeat protein
MVITWIVFHVLWALLSKDIPFLEMVAVALMAVGFWLFFGLLLLRRIRLIRFLLLLAVIARIVFLWEEANLWMFDYHDFGAMARDPSTGWASNVSLLLSGVLLVMAYLTPVADQFEAEKPPHSTRIGRMVAAVTRSDGAIVTVSTAVVLVVFVVNQFVIGARYAENSPHALISTASEYLDAAQATGDESEVRYAYLELGDAYWLLRKREQAASMYEKFVAVTLKQTEFSSWALARAIVRLMQFYTAASDVRFGDGSHALAMAERLPDYARKAAYFDALAAVYARIGNLDKAVQHQKTAIEKCIADGCCEACWQYAYHLSRYTGESY